MRSQLLVIFFVLFCSGTAVGWEEIENMEDPLMIQNAYYAFAMLMSGKGPKGLYEFELPEIGTDPAKNVRIMTAKGMREVSC